jgi:hypothetical protein
MSRFTILCLCLLWPCSVSAGQATGQFSVGITITGKRASPTPAAGGAAAEAAASARTKSFAKAVYPRRVRNCSTKYLSYDPATRTYIGHDGNVHRCP